MFTKLEIYTLESKLKIVSMYSYLLKRRGQVHQHKMTRLYIAGRRADGEEEERRQETFSLLAGKKDTWARTWGLG